MGGETLGIAWVYAYGSVKDSWVGICQVYCFFGFGQVGACYYHFETVNCARAAEDVIEVRFVAFFAVVDS